MRLPSCCLDLTWQGGQAKERRGILSIVYLINRPAHSNQKFWRLENETHRECERLGLGLGMK
jgi:hypothetical protein